MPHYGPHCAGPMSHDGVGLAHPHPCGDVQFPVSSAEASPVPTGCSAPGWDAGQVPAEGLSPDSPQEENTLLPAQKTPNII